MDVCEEFIANKWKPDLCTNCQKHEAEHRSVSCQIQELEHLRTTENQHKENINHCQKSSIPTRKTCLPRPRDTKQQCNLTRATSRSDKAANRTLTARQSENKQNELKTNASNSASSEKKRFTTLGRPTVPPPKPTGVVARSSSLRVATKPVVSEKPANVRKLVKKSESLRQTRYNGSGNTVSCLSKPHYQNISHTAGDRRTGKTTVVMDNEDKEDELPSENSPHDKTFDNTLGNLGLDTKSLHHEDYSALENAWKFFEYKNYQERLHESPFHKLAHKIKQHHAKHMQSGADKPRPLMSYVSTESFYGSVDVTGTNEKYDKPSSNQAVHAGNVYDNAIQNAIQNTTQNDTQNDNNDTGYDNNINVTNVGQSSPRYDPVAINMQTSQEANNSERIYAEVLDTVVIQTTPQTGLHTSEYEEPDNITYSADTLNKISTVTTFSNQAVESSNSTRPTRMSFLKTLLKKGKKDISPGGVRQDEIGGEYITGGVQAVLKNKTHLSYNTSSHSLETPKETLNIKSSLNNNKQLSVSVPSESYIIKQDKSKVKTLRSSISPKETAAQRPEVRPPPPPSDPEKREDQIMSQTLDHSASKNKLLLAKDRNGDFIPISQSGTSRRGSKQSDPKDGYYEAPWSNPEQIISSILKQDPNSTSKYSRATTGKQSGKHVAMNLKIPEYKAKKGGMHGRQYSAPTDGIDSRRGSDSSYKFGKLSPPVSATDSGYESGTMTSIRRSAPPSSSESGSYGRLSLPGSNNSSRPSSPQAKITAVDSVSVCLEQINSMNISTLQKLNKAFLERNSIVSDIPKTEWSELDIEDEQTPLHYNNKCVFYKAQLKENSKESLTVLISLKAPSTSKSYMPHLLLMTEPISVSIRPSLIPQQIIASYKSSSPPTESAVGESNCDGQSAGSPKAGDNCYDKPWDNLLEKDKKRLEESYKEGLLHKEKTSELLETEVQAYATFTHSFYKMESVQTYLKRRDTECQMEEEFVMDSLFILLQVLHVLFNLSDNLLQIDTLSANDLCVILDNEMIPTVVCHMLSVKKSSVDYSLTCEKLRMFLIQMAHISDRLSKCVTFKKVEDLISNSTDQGDLRTISLIIQYLLWGPKSEEIKIMSVAESRKQAFDLWVQLARAKLLNRLASQQMDKLKIYMISNFLANTNGPELFKITKLLSTY